VIRRPKTTGLAGKHKATFLANSKKITQKFKSEMDDENRTKATRLDRLTYKSEVKKL
jgi:hypothetical protein